MRYVVTIDGKPVASFGSALKEKAEAELEKAQQACFGTNSKAELRTEE